MTEAMLINELKQLPIEKRFLILKKINYWWKYFRKKWTFGKYNLIKLSSADCFQIRSISNQRLIRKIGNINKIEFF